jgi:hypothetical protein
VPVISGRLTLHGHDIALDRGKAAAPWERKNRLINRIISAAIRGVTAGTAVIRFRALRRGSRGPLARADIRRDHGDPICACGCAEVWVAPRGWPCPHCDLPIPHSTLRTGLNRAGHQTSECKDPPADIVRVACVIGMKLGSRDD